MPFIVGGFLFSLSAFDIFVLAVHLLYGFIVVIGSLRSSHLLFSLVLVLYAFVRLVFASFWFLFCSRFGWIVLHLLVEFVFLYLSLLLIIVLVFSLCEFMYYAL